MPHFLRLKTAASQSSYDVVLIEYSDEPANWSFRFARVRILYSIPFPLPISRE